MFRFFDCAKFTNSFNAIIQDIKTFKISQQT